MNHFAFGWLLITLGFASGACSALAFTNPVFSVDTTVCDAA